MTGLDAPITWPIHSLCIDDWSQLPFCSCGDTVFSCALYSVSHLRSTVDLLVILIYCGVVYTHVVTYPLPYQRRPTGTGIIIQCSLVWHKVAELGNFFGSLCIMILSWLRVCCYCSTSGHIISDCGQKWWLYPLPRPGRSLTWLRLAVTQSRWVFSNHTDVAVVICHYNSLCEWDLTNSATDGHN